jgi:hypothetical protein
VDERALDDLRALAERDRALEEQGAALRAADAEVARIRRRAEEIAAFFSLYGDEEARRRDELRAAEQELAERRGELAEAEAEAARAPDEEQRELAEKAVGRARDHVSVAGARVDRASAAATELETGAAAFQAELPELDHAARGVQGARVPAGDLVAWASHAHAELFVALGQLDLQRERLIREANELASALTGEATYGSTAAQALARAERLRSPRSA